MCVYAKIMMSMITESGKDEKKFYIHLSVYCFLRGILKKFMTNFTMQKVFKPWSFTKWGGNLISMKLYLTVNLINSSAFTYESLLRCDLSIVGESNFSNK
jgi:hypothetical protein